MDASQLGVIRAALLLFFLEVSAPLLVFSS